MYGGTLHVNDPVIQRNIIIYTYSFFELSTYPLGEAKNDLSELCKYYSSPLEIKYASSSPPVRLQATVRVICEIFLDFSV